MIMYDIFGPPTNSGLASLFSSQPFSPPVCPLSPQFHQLCPSTFPLPFIFTSATLIFEQQQQQQQCHRSTTTPLFVITSSSSPICAFNEPMASMRAFFNRFLLLLIHLGCFAIFSTNPIPSTQQDQQQPPPKRRKITPLPQSSSTSNLNPQKSFSRSVLSYLSHLLSFRKPDHVNENNDKPQQQHQPTSTPPSPCHSVPLTPTTTPPHITSSNSIQHDSSLATARRDDIFPCSACGEVLAKPQLLELHQAMKHSLSELRDCDSGKNIVRIIFHSGWRGTTPPVVHRIFKIHNSPKTLARFEEYREIVRSRAASRRGTGDGRCIADGNERLRFYCSTALCALGRISGPGLGVLPGSPGGVCGSQYCSTCGIVRHGFMGKQVDLDGIATHATGWGAHVSLPEELEREFAFLPVRRAVLVCRVVAGRVARGEEADEEKKGAVFDSVVPVPRRGHVEEEELLVFNPRAVLPCFVIVYSA